MSQQLTPMEGGLGAVITGLDLREERSESVLRNLIALLHEHGVIVIRDQKLSDAQFAAFGENWGRPLEFFLPKDRDPIHPTIIHINNDASTPVKNRDGAVHWHSDSTYEEEPAAVTMLYGRETPDEGGITHFASTAAAYESLSADMKNRIDNLVAIHSLGKAPWIEGETVPDPTRGSPETPDQRHKLVMTHPVTGRKAIFTSGTAYAIEGMAQEEATELIRFLRSHIVQPEFRASYKVQKGDIVLWDNFSTVHTASPIEYSNEPGKRRLLQRISTKGMPKLCA